ncbi:MAG: NAD-binding protein [Thermoplasmatota archaeon]
MKESEEDAFQTEQRSSVLSRILNFLQEREWYIIVIIGAVGVACGFIGYGRYFNAADEPISLWDRFYFTLQLIGMEFSSVNADVPPELEVARFLLPILTVYTIARAILEIFRYKIGLLRIRLMRNHVVLCGLGEKGSFILEDLRRNGDEVVGVEIEEDVPSIKAAREKGARVVIGDAASEKVLLSAGIRKAEMLIVTCDDESTNIEVAKRARSLRNGRPLRTFVHIKDMQFCPLVERTKGQQGINRIRFFNVFESGARQLLKEHPPDEIAGAVSKNDIRIAIVGFGPLGENVLLQTLKIGHYARNRKLHITVLGENVEKSGRVFRARFVQLDNIKDIRVRFKDIEMDKSGRFDPDLIFDGNEPMDVIYICLEDDTLSQSCALNINKNPRGVVAPIVINMLENVGFATVLQKEKNPYMVKNKLHMFTPIKKACERETVVNESLDNIARAFHFHYLKMKKKEARKKKIELDRSEPSLRHWTELPEALKESNRQAADHIDVKLRAIDCRKVPLKKLQRSPGFKFSKKEIEELGRMEHHRWNAERFLDGWALSDKKDILNKKSPYLRDWTDPELPEDIKDYDREFVVSIPDILALVEPRGFKIARNKKR